MDLDNDGDDDLFKITIADRRMPELRPKEMKFYAKPIFDMFDSTERINPFVFTKKQEKTWKDKISNISLEDSEKIINKAQKKCDQII
jgi:hypothetical protein